MNGIFNGLADALDLALRLYLFCVLIAVLLPLLQPNPFNPIVRFFRSLTEPVFQWIRRRLPFVVIGAFDLSPLLIWLAVIFLQRALLDNLRLLGR